MIPFVLVFPEISERMQVRYGIVEGKDEEVDNDLNDIINDAYGFCYSCTFFISQIVGSELK